MPNVNIFDDLSAKLGELFKSNVTKDIEKNIRALLMQGFAKLDLVTREEFDIQAELLSRTRQQLIELEARITEMEVRRDVK